jgi:GTPase Era involved in 16S rRNA processing
VVGSQLASCTRDIQVVKVAHPSASGSIVFVDTPGFDDDTMSDAEVLSRIAKWLNDT